MTQSDKPQSERTADNGHEGAPTNELACSSWSVNIKSGLRSLAASFPVAASFGQAWSEYEGRRTAERIAELFDDVQKELAAQRGRLEAQEVSLEPVKDFPELLEITVEKVRREYTRAKREAYARLLTRLAVGDNERNHDEKVAVLESLDSLTEFDLNVLRLFHGQMEARIDGLDWRSILEPGRQSDQLAELPSNLARLEARGLIMRSSVPIGVVKYKRDNLTPEASQVLDLGYRVLTLGKTVTELLFGDPPSQP